MMYDTDAWQAFACLLVCLFVYLLLSLPLHLLRRSHGRRRPGVLARSGRRVVVERRGAVVPIGRAAVDVDIHGGLPVVQRFDAPERREAAAELPEVERIVRPEQDRAQQGAKEVEEGEEQHDPELSGEGERKNAQEQQAAVAKSRGRKQRNK